MFNRDYAVVQGVVLCSAVAYLLLNLCADVAYLMLNLCAVTLEAPPAPCTAEPEGDAAAVASIRTAPWWPMLRRQSRRPAAMIGAAVLICFVALAAGAPLLSPYDPIATSWTAVRKAPSLAHPFGTDELGRDVLARVIWSSRASLTAAVVAVGMATAVGVPIGLASGYAGGALVDAIVMRLVDAMLAIPFLILAIALAAFLGPSLTNAMIAIGIAQIPIFARLTRGQVLAIKEEDYIEAAQAVGNKPCQPVSRCRKPGGDDRVEPDRRQRQSAKPPRQHDHPRRATLRIYDPAWFLAEGMVSTWTQRSFCHSSNPLALVFAVMRRAIAMASASSSQATPWI